jgi:DNA-binding NarL/FixJ family response regulator
MTSQPNGEPMKVAIVDDHADFGDALALAIEAAGDMTCVGVATRIADAEALVERTQPDLILLDVRLPDGDGIAAIGRFRVASPTAQILILTGHMDADVFIRAANSGATGFLRKESSLETILRSIRAARAGEIIVEQATLAAILGAVARHPRPGSVKDPSNLTVRELEVLRLMGMGQDPNAIADHLAIRLGTVRGYEKAILSKLGAHTQLEAVTPHLGLA